MNDDRIAVHLNPARRARANFVIRADIREQGSPRDFEQLWARRTSDQRFELCCIPFFAYDMALGDEVETDAAYLIERVVQPAGGFTFRAWFGDSSVAGAGDAAVEALLGLGAELEWYSENLLAVHAADERSAQQMADYLQATNQAGHLVYETGRTREP